MSIKDHDPSSTGSDADAEKADLVDSGDGSPHGSLHRQLKNRHIAMIRWVLSALLLSSMRGFADRFWIYSRSIGGTQPPSDHILMTT
jgi:hypothetical protein